MNPDTKTGASGPQFGYLHGVERMVLETCPYQIADSLEKGCCVLLEGLDLAPW